VSAHEVHFILDPRFGGDLWELSRGAHVWICNSPENDPRIDAVWAPETEEYSELMGVTSFALGGDVAQTFYSFLGTIEDHHGEHAAAEPWSAIHVLGLRPRTSRWSASWNRRPPSRSRSSRAQAASPSAARLESPLLGRWHQAQGANTMRTPFDRL
jgi:hypothetical protein